MLDIGSEVVALGGKDQQVRRWELLRIFGDEVRVHGEVSGRGMYMQAPRANGFEVRAPSHEADGTAKALQAGGLYEHRSVVASDASEARDGDVLE